MTYATSRPAPLGLRLRRARRKFAKKHPRLTGAARRIRTYAAFTAGRVRANAAFTVYALVSFGAMAYIMIKLAPLA